MELIGQQAGALDEYRGVGHVLERPFVARGHGLDFVHYVAAFDHFAKYGIAKAVGVGGVVVVRVAPPN